MRIRALIVAGVCALAALAPASALAKAHHAKKKHAKPTYYLALGDSLARGAQPNAAGVTKPTSQGYANDIYAAEKRLYKNLKLEQLGCLGETTETMINGGCVDGSYKAGSQLKAAVAFIKSHKIAFITLDIGANDIDGCVVNGSINASCLADGTTAISTDVPKIVAALRKAAGSKTRIAGMTYYDPFLADYLVGGSYGQGVAEDSTVLAKQVNGTLSSDFAAQKLKVADVATAFDTYGPFTQTEVIPGFGAVPEPVGQICALTWMCAPAPVGPNIHLNANGYRLAATVFEKVL
jgi:lysophospholipase L1-like esterase